MRHIWEVALETLVAFAGFTNILGIVEILINFAGIYLFAFGYKSYLIENINCKRKD